MNELEEDLRSVSETIVDEADRLKQIEEFKATLPVDDPRVLALSEEAERLAEQMADMASAEKDLAVEASQA